MVLLTAGAYQQTWYGSYIWDDDSYVTSNRTLRDLHGLWRIWFQLSATPQYYPLVHTSFWLEYHLWGLNPLGYHLVNVSLQALGTVLLWRVLKRLRVPGAWLAAAIFAVHPVEVESVAWITERKNVLSAVFYFGSALAYLAYAPFQKSEKAAGRERIWFYLASLFLFVLALLSKTVACTLPAALLVVRWWKQGRLRKEDIISLLPFFVLGLGLGLLTAWLEQHHVRAQGAEWAFTPAQRILIAGRALWFYAGKLFWPSKLTFIYPRWEVSPRIAWQWLFPTTLLAVLAMLWVRREQIGRGPLAAALFFVVTLGPALGFVNVFPFRYSFVADHFQYLASIGLIILAAAGLNRLPRLIPASLIALLAFLTWSRAAIYRNPETLWADTLDKNPASWMVQNSIADVLLRKGEIDEAINHYELALKSNPNDVVTHNGLGYAFLLKGEVNLSLTHLKRALELFPNYTAAHFNLANTLLQMGRTEEALSQLQEVLALDPDDPEAQKNMAWLLATSPDERLRDGRRAVDLAESANKAENRDPSFRATLGAAYAETGRFADAIKIAEGALQSAIDSGNMPLANLLRAQLELYRSGRPFRDIR